MKWMLNWKGLLGSIPCQDRPRLSAKLGNGPKPLLCIASADMNDLSSVLG